MVRERSGVQTGCMPSTLTEPPGIAPPSGDATLSPLRRWRHDHGERVTDRWQVGPGQVLVGYDGTPEAAAVVRWAAACAGHRRVLVAHCWTSRSNPHDVAVAVRACVHPHAVRRVLEAAHEHDAAARAEAERIVAAGVALTQEAGAEASGMCVPMTGSRGVVDALGDVASGGSVGGVVVGARPRRGWRRLLGRGGTAGVLSRRLSVPVAAVPLVSEREDN